MKSNLYEHAWEYDYDMTEDETWDKPRSPWACARCGSTQWPDPHADCFMCREEPEPEEL